MSSERRVLVPEQLSKGQLHGLGSTALPVRFDGTAMGTVWTATVLAPAALSSSECRQVIVGAFEEVIRQMSGWSETSDLARFNRAPAGSWMELPPGFFTVLTRALEIARASYGAYDPTVGEVVDLLGFGPSERQEPAPDGQLLAARERLGWWRIQTNPATGRLQPGGVRVDLSSIAKGYAVDLAAERLVAAGVESFLVELGGEARARGCKPDGQPWWCWVERPPISLGETSLPETVVALCDGSLASSGGYRRSRENGGQLRSHIVNPRTGDAGLGALASVTVLCPTCMDADAYATALFVLGWEEGLSWAEERGLSALFVWRTSEGLAEKWTSNWGRMVE